MVRYSVEAARITVDGGIATGAVERQHQHLRLTDRLAAQLEVPPRFEDRTRFAGVVGGRDLYVESMRARTELGARPEVTVIGTAGECVAISRSLWAGGPADGRFERSSSR